MKTANFFTLIKNDNVIGKSPNGLNVSELTKLQSSLDNFNSFVYLIYVYLYALRTQYIARMRGSKSSSNSGDYFLHHQSIDNLLTLSKTIRGKLV